MKPLLLFILSLQASLSCDVLSTDGEIKFDVNSNASAEMILTTTGLGLGMVPTSNLHINGNAIITERLSIGNNSGTSNLNIQGAISFDFQVITSDTTLGSNTLIYADTSASNITLTLPAANEASGRIYKIKKTSLLNQLWIDSSGNIDGYDGSLEMTNYNTGLSYAEITNNGVEWYVFNKTNDTLSVIAADNLVGWWKLDEAAGSTIARDSSAREKHGTYSSLSSANIGVAGLIGTATSFDGVNDSVQLPIYTDVGSDLGSVSLFMKTSVVSGSSSHLFYANNSSSGDGFGGETEMHLNLSTTEIQFVIVGSGGNTTLSISSAFTYNDNNWHHLVATWDINGNARLYIDSVLKTSNAHNANNFAFLQHVSLARPTSSIRFYQGNLDDVRLYNKALSLQEIQTLYQQSQ